MCCLLLMLGPAAKDWGESPAGQISAARSRWLAAPSLQCSRVIWSGHGQSGAPHLVMGRMEWGARCR